MDWKDRIEVNPEVAYGKPVIRGTRIAVEFVLELLAGGSDEAYILENYPHLRPEDIRACLAFASHLMHEYRA
ncbi:MAG: DUF433 domain-containing protein [Bryobacterales bacterium]|nr:DUF433 domain-containing protein [Bryobacterales bacterium]